MITGVISSIFTAWFLNLFGASSVMLELLQPFFEIELTTMHYYAIAGLIGFIGGSISSNS